MIGEYAFAYCSGLTSLAIPSSVSSIGRAAFYKCSGLTSLSISSGVTMIGEYAFAYCSGLTSLSIPSSVTSIGEEAFANESLKSMYVYWNIPVPISVDVFDNEVIQNSTLYIPKGTYDNYWLTNWGVFDNIVEFDVTGIDETATTGEVKETSRYSVNGQLLCMPIKGLNLVKYSDGVVKKVVVR